LSIWINHASVLAMGSCLGEARINPSRYRLPQAVGAPSIRLTAHDRAVSRNAGRVRNAPDGIRADRFCGSVASRARPQGRIS
jgi:hypothetical protein